MDPPIEAVRRPLGPKTNTFLVPPADGLPVSSVVLCMVVPGIFTPYLSSSAFNSSMYSDPPGMAEDMEGLALAAASYCRLPLLPEKEK